MKLDTNLGESFAYWASCAVATYEGAMGKKSTPKCDKDRFLSIAEGMIRDADRYGVKNQELEHARERLQRAKEIVP